MTDEIRLSALMLVSVGIVFYLFAVVVTL